jgi:hypothetical protein
MRHDKEKIFELRKRGKTYREISKLATISKGTLCEWFRNETWSDDIKKNNTDKQISTSISKMHAARRKLLDFEYANNSRQAEQEFELFKNDPLFIAGLMLYSGEGDKRTIYQVRLANVDFDTHKIFLKFIEKFTKIKIDRIRFSILLYPDLDITKCKEKWSLELGIPLSNFHKPQVIQGRSKVRRLHFGVGSTIISDSFLKRKIMKWIEMSNHFLIS